MEKNKSQKLWGGRFEESTAASVEAFTESISYDKRLYSYDIMGSKAHATMLAANGLLSDVELKAIVDGLSAIETSIDEGSFSFKSELEDIHMNIEKALVEKVGQAGEKLHTARSRNDQVALDMRLYLRQESLHLVQLLTELQKGFVSLAREYLGV
ncbi:MAG: argininosuccinate lyase, partial [Desulfocapsa sp.]|nr:argininosuccinate lyase [Desulfocapsa sp.]